MIGVSAGKERCALQELEHEDECNYGYQRYAAYLYLV
jgi:hypothetical protein